MRRLESLEFALHQLEQAITTIVSLGPCMPGWSSKAIDELVAMEARASDPDGMDSYWVSRAVKCVRMALEDELVKLDEHD
jgi:hypothetical protein